MRTLLILRVFCLALLCLAASFVGANPTLHANDWPQWLGPDRDGVWRESGLIEKFPKDGPRIVWRTPVGGGYSGPAVANGLVYLTDRQKAKDAQGKPIQGTKGGTPGIERILCLNQSDGQLVWKHEYECVYKISYPAGPRTTPLVHNGRLYSLGAMGDMICLDAATGKVRWSKNVSKDYQVNPPLWGYSASLLIDDNRLYSLVGGKESAVVAFNPDDGKELWHALTAPEIAYSPPMIYQIGGMRQLIIWHSESINGLNPVTGEVYWTVKYPQEGKPRGPSVNIATVRQIGDRLFLTSTYHGPMLLKVEGAKASVLWEIPNKTADKPESLCCLNSTPVIKDGHIYGVGCQGDLRCLDLETGKGVWQTYDELDGKLARCGTAFLVPQQDRFILFNDQGDLILATLTPQGYKETSRAHILEPLGAAFGRQVVWSFPAFANRCVFMRNDKELVCVSLAAETSR